MAKRKGSRKPRPSNEEIRLRILKLLYEEHQQSGTLKRYLWTELKRKVRNEFTAPETTRNLDYLIQNSFIRKDRKSYTGPKGKTFGTKRETYRVSPKTIDFFEEGSQFSAEPSLQGLSITGDYNIVQIGTNVFAYAEYRDLQTALVSLLQGVILSDELLPEQKLQAFADIKAIVAQLLKPEQDPTLLNRLKEKLSWLANVAGLAGFFANVLHHWPF